MKYINTNINERSLKGDKISAIKKYVGKRVVLTDTERGIIGVKITENHDSEHYLALSIKSTGKRTSGPVIILEYNNLEQMYVEKKQN